MKLVLKIVSIGALGLLLIFVALALAVDPLLAKVLRQGVTRATGTATALESVDLGLVSGRLELAGFAIHNPAGYRDEPFLALAEGRVAVNAGSLLGSRIEVRSIELDGVVLNIEAKGTDTNYGAILEHMRGLADGADEAPEAPAEGGPRKTLVVERIVVTDVRAALHLDVPLLEGGGAILIPRVEIEDFESDGSTAENVAKLTRALVEALLGAVLESGGELLPGELLKDLKGELGDLRATIGEDARGILESVGEGASLQEVGDEVERAAKQVGGAVKDLLGKKKKD